MSSILNEHRDWSKTKTSICTKRVWCDACFGSKRQRLRSQGVIPHVKIIACRKCYGFGKIWVVPNGESDKRCSQIIPGLWKHGNSYGGKHFGRR